MALSTGHGTSPKCIASLIAPFPDEPNQVVVPDYQPRWPAEFEGIAGQLSGALSDISLAIDHVGSTSVPGLAAKDCIDVQVRVAGC